MQLMEMRNSPDYPFLFMAWLDPVSGNSTVIPLPDDWYLVRPKPATSVARMQVQAPRGWCMTTRASCCVTHLLVMRRTGRSTRRYSPPSGPAPPVVCGRTTTSTSTRGSSCTTRFVPGHVVLVAAPSMVFLQKTDVPCPVSRLRFQCGGEGDDCDENESLVALAWVPPVDVDWYVAVEPVEPQLTQMVWTYTNVIN